MSPARLLALWDRLGGSAPGRWLFSRLIGFAVPYSGSIGARVESLSPGRVVLSLRDRRKVRQHLGSVHAIALANLAELSSGMAMLSSLPPGVRGIVTGISISYHTKARGTLTATGTASAPAVTGPVESQALAKIVNQDSEVVADAVVTWRLDLVPDSEAPSR